MSLSWTSITGISLFSLMLLLVLTPSLCRMHLLSPLPQIRWLTYQSRARPPHSGTAGLLPSVSHMSHFSDIDMLVVGRTRTKSVPATVIKMPDGITLEGTTVCMSPGWYDTLTSHPLVSVSMPILNQIGSLLETLPRVNFKLKTHSTWAFPVAFHVFPSVLLPTLLIRVFYLNISVPVLLWYVCPTPCTRREWKDLGPLGTAPLTTYIA